MFTGIQRYVPVQDDSVNLQIAFASSVRDS